MTDTSVIDSLTIKQNREDLEYAHTVFNDRRLARRRELAATKREAG